jgi:Ca2+:H+ antiporter
MAGAVPGRTPWWEWTWPLLALAVLASSVFVGLPGALATLAGGALMAAVSAVVYHAEVVAHRVGERAQIAGPLS